MNYIALSVPVFFLLILLELAWSAKKGLKLYRLNDSIANISCGIGQQLTDIIFKSLLFFSYIYIYEHFRLFSIPQTWYWWLILFLGVDFCYYWFHRLSHEVNAIWATHVVHHQSEEYNLSVALRQSWFQGFFSNFFYLPLALLGFNPLWTITVIAFNTLYQFWIHTETIKNMGWLEYIFNTPSHHRVHHGSNPQYIDRNHGGSLIIWDRMFGTFEPEGEKVRYGITIPLKSWNPLWANLHYWVDLFRLASNTKGLPEKIKVFIKSPGHTDFGFNPGSEFRKFEISLSKAEAYYAFFQFVLILGLASFLLFNTAGSSLLKLSPILGWSFFSIVSLGLYLQQSPFRLITEFLRLAALPICFAISFNPDQKIIILLAALSILSLIHLFPASRKSQHSGNQAA
ncbi:MAG: sterol desaturase family protein [Bacteroidetes bacterium]|nr:sterol desaturase family protein [Bacteroidota bacterium]